MVHHQNVRNAIVWNHEKREYQHIITLQDILECILYVADKLQVIISGLESHFKISLDS